MPNNLTTLNAKDTKTRLILIGLILFALIFAWFSVRRQLGNMLAELTSSAQPNAKDVAKLASSLAPNDPLAKWLEASVEKDIFTAETIERSVKLYEEVVRLSPNDFRWWVELGRAYEQAEKYEQSEKAFRHALTLAPNYTYPHWQLGNFYLRQNRSDEAFAELGKAAENNAVYREQVFSIAWDYFEKDTAKIEQLAGNSLEAKQSLVKFYANKNLANEALKVWNSISEEDKSKNLATAKFIAQVVYEKKAYRSAVEFSRQAGVDADSTVDAISNAGFEKLIGDSKETYFGWKVNSVPKMETRPDLSQKHEGTRSYRVTFNGFVGLSLQNIVQLIAVEPNKKYVLSFWIKTETLRSAGNPTLEVVNASDDKIIIASNQFPSGTNDWQQIKLDFTVPENTEGIYIRTARSFCGEGCPIVGTFWYDDFSLTKQ